MKGWKGEKPGGKGPKGGEQTKGGGAWFPLGKTGLSVRNGFISYTLVLLV